MRKACTLIFCFLRNDLTSQKNEDNVLPLLGTVFNFNEVHLFRVYPRGCFLSSE